MPAGDAPLHILGAHHVAVHTPDLARLRAFYVDTLGLPVVGGFPEHGILFVAAGGTIVELIEEGVDGGGASTGATPGGAVATTGDEPCHAPDRGRRAGWNHLALAVEDVDAAYAELAARGVALRSVPESFPPEAPAFRIAFVADPDGNPLELIQPMPGAC